MHPVLCFTASIFVFGLSFFASGCQSQNEGDSPPLGRVSGHVRLDGKPLEGATVIFNPIAGGRGSSGVTDSSGGYELDYTHNQQGAILGEHQVRINSASFAGEGAADPLLPAEYNSDTQLRFTVPASGGMADFELKSDGSVEKVQ